MFNRGPNKEFSFLDNVNLNGIIDRSQLFGNEEFGQKGIFDDQIVSGSFGTSSVNREMDILAAAPVDPVLNPEYDPMREKIRSNPYVLYLAGLTGLILIGGLVSFKQGKQRQSQMFMRARVVAQGATITLMMYSLYKYRNEAIEEHKATVAYLKEQEDKKKEGENEENAD